MDGASGDQPGYGADGCLPGCASRPESNAGLSEALLDECAAAPPASLQYTSWLKKIEDLWRARASGTVIRSAVHECLHATDSPYEAAIYLLENCSDLAVKKVSTLACTLAKDVEKWTVANAGSEQHQLSSELLERAFSVATRHHLLLFDALCGAMNFRSRVALFVDRVDSLVSAGADTVGVCQLVAKLGLQQRYGLAAFAVPLIALDRVNMLELYVDDAPALQVELVMQFDELCRPNSSLDELLQASSAAVGAKPGGGGAHLQKRVLAKHGLRLMKKYGVSPDCCQHIVDYHGAMGIRFLVHRYFDERCMSRDAFCELLAVAARDRPRLCEEVVLQLLKHREVVLAAKWARHCRHLPSESLPAEVAAALRTLPPVGAGGDWSSSASQPNSEVQAESNGLPSSEYYALVLPLSEVEMVDTVQAYHAAINSIIASGGPLAIDCEWAPSFNTALDHPLSIMQLAVSSHVWLFDMLALPSCLGPGDWERLKQLFGDRGLVKLGFGFSEDFRKMQSAMPGFRGSDLVSFVDLAKLYAASKPARRSNSSESAGLADVVRATLGKSVDKQEQMSNWERRPLRQAQLRYAAQDAHCLLAVYDALLARTEPGASDPPQLPAALGDGRGGVTGETCRLPLPQESVGAGPLDAAAAAAAVGERHTERPRSAPISADRLLPTPPRHVQQQQQSAAAAQAGAAVPWPAIDPVRGSSVDEPSESGLSVADLHLVVDSMLQGLGRKLRNLGVDTVISGNDDDRDDVARLCLRDGRVLLSAGEPYRRFCQLLPPDRCFAVDHTLPADAQAEFVLNRFSVRLTQSDIFGRCQACNGGEYVEVPAAAMRAMCSQRGSDGSRSTAVAAAMPAAADGPAAASSAAGRAGSACTVDYESARLSTGVPLQLDDVRPGSLATVDVYRVCATCGKVFWEGSHHRRMATLYSDRLGR